MLNESQEIAAAIDIGGTKIAVGLVSKDGRILVSETTPTEPQAGFEAAIHRMAAMLQHCTQQLSIRPVGIGIGCTGPVDPFTGVLGEVNLLPGWQGKPLTAALTAATGLQAVVENDADATALGEAAFGVGKGAGSFLLVAVGTGIGGGLIVDGHLYRGAGGAHPEIGHFILVPQGTPCTCGAHGCWEAYASGPALETWFNQNHPQESWWDGRRIFAAADAGNPQAREAIERTAHFLGLGISNLITMFCPEVIGLAGGLMERWDDFAATVQTAIHENCRMVPHTQVRLERARLGGQAGLLGAARVWWSRREANSH